MVSSTDGVGTKIEIANILNKFNTIGIDLVAMCVNDILVLGAKPLFFLDYISIDKINLTKLKNIIKGIHEGCKMSECQLVGGETAEMPGTYSKNKFDLAGFSVGLVNKNNALKKEKIKENNLILAIPSSGLHSNGYSLLREVLKKKKINIKKNKFLRNEILKPTKIYVKEIMNLLDRKLINGCANITGGGIGDNIERVIPKNLCARIDLDKIKTHKIFSWINKNGVSQKEMLKTFNCGVGFCLIIKKNNFHKILKFFPKESQDLEELALLQKQGVNSLKISFIVCCSSVLTCALSLLAISIIDFDHPAFLAEFIELKGNIRPLILMDRCVQKFFRISFFPGNNSLQ